MARKRYLSEGWQICSKCQQGETGHKSGVCLACRRSSQLKPKVDK